MLCDHAVVADGKLYIHGGGWSTAAIPNMTSGLAILLHVGWAETNQKQELRVSLKDDDGVDMTQPNPVGGEDAIAFGIEFEVGRPPGIAHGSELTLPFAANFPPLPLAAGKGYCWTVAVGDQELERASFRVAP